MGLDIYAGTLTRYYSGNWKTVVQQMAEENGWTYNRVTPDNLQEDDLLPVNEVQEIMEGWSSGTSDALGSYYNTSCEVWEENNEKDYYTDKPDWPAFGALILYVACAKYQLPLPKQVEKNWNFQEDPIVLRAIEDPEFGYPLFQSTEWWLPFDEVLYFSCHTPKSIETLMGTTASLLNELREINELGWNADEATIFKWQKTEGYPVDGEVSKGFFKKLKKNDMFDVQSLAKFAFSIFYQAALFSKENRVPIIMDY